MKFFLKAALVLSAGCISAQSYRHCGFNDAQDQLFRMDPSAKARFEQLSEQAAERDKKEFQSGYKMAQVATYTIPVVFHVLHKGGNENISDAQIHNALAILNRDFQKQNSDTTNIVTQFKNLAADCQIQFSLATIDEFGQCTNGITRHYDSRTNWTVSASGYAYTWDPSKYLNIYVVKTLQNGAAGYTYLPGTVGAVMDAIVVLHNYTGSIGTSNMFTSRTLTHEVGHWLNLPHIWGSTNSPGVACGDDGVSDTPVTKGHTNCNLSNAITCNAGVTENIQNYMEYSYCTCMFTVGQRTRMHNALNSGVGGRNNLSTPSNLSATGVLNPLTGCAPKAEFVNTTSVTCVGNTLPFTDYSYNAAPTTWLWSSQLASNTSTLQNGVLTFSASGLAPVKLVVSNANGSDSITKQVVTVMAGPGSGAGNTSEGFETNPFPNANWVTTLPTFGSTFVKTTSAAATGSSSIWVNNYFDNPSGPVAVFTPAYDLQNNISVDLSFKYAYTQQSAMNDDVLKVSVSTNCGQTWTNVFNKSGSALSTTGGSLIAQSYLNPQPSHWKTENINLLSFSGNSQVYIRFEFTPDASSPGNNIFIDDININQVVGLKENRADLNFITVYPNPFHKGFTIKNTGAQPLRWVKLYDVSMRQVGVVDQEQLTQPEIELNDFDNYKAGVYFAEIKTANGSRIVKLVKL